MSSVGGPAAAADLAALRTQVTPENVLLLHNGLKAEAQIMREQIQSSLQWRVGEPGKDLVSPQAANAFNGKINTLKAHLTAYVNMLASMADNLAKTAQTYGHTETQIADSFIGFYSEYKHEAAVFGPTSHTGGR